MPRRRRLQVTGLPVHIIQRGNNRQACFFAEADYQFFLHHIGELAKRFECELHAYVLMTNHVHLLLTPYLGRGPSLLMKLLGQRYVLACYRYIELNPVRANMVTHPISPGPTRFCLVLGTDPVHLQYEAREAFDRRQAADLGIKLAA